MNMFVSALLTVLKGLKIMKKFSFKSTCCQITVDIDNKTPRESPTTVVVV